jgi:uncharacterized HAD superfamily protein
MTKRPIVLDIDGTLTAEPYNEKNLETLKENPAMVFVAKAMQENHPILISTARPERYREQTERWLESQGLKPRALYMRPDSREGVPDHMVKFGHLQDILKEFGKPALWVDDLESNIAMLKKNDIPVIHVKQ